MKKLTRILCFALCVLMLAGTLAACDSKKPDTTTPDTTPQTPDSSGYESTYTPSGTTYEGADFVILLSSKAGSVTNFYEFADENPTVIDLAVQKKNAAVEADYDVKITSTKIAGKDSPGVAKMQSSFSSGSLDYHMSHIDAYGVVPLSYQDNLYELNSLTGLNLKNEWWDQNANTDLAVDDLVFFTTGDIDAWDDMQQFIMIFNTDLFKSHVKDYSLEEFYKLSEDGKWTYDVFFKIAKGFTEDANGDSIMDNNDLWGMVTWDDTIYATFVASGGKIVSIQDSDLSLSILTDENAQNCMRLYTEWTQQNAYNYSVRDNWNGTKANKMFTNNQVLFNFERLQVVSGYRDMDSDFGLVPAPKFTEDQDYHVFCSPYHLNFICTLNLEESIQMRGDVMESLAYYSKQHLTPAYREKTLEGQEARDDGSLNTLALTAENRTYDYGFYLQPGNIGEELIQLYRNWSTDYASMYAKVKTPAETAIKNVEDAYKNLIKEWQS